MNDTSMTLLKVDKDLVQEIEESVPEDVVARASAVIRDIRQAMDAA